MIRQYRHSATYGHAPASGFTIVELVAIIVIIGVLGVVAIARYVSPNAFNEQGAQDALITSIRQAQQAALGRSDVSFEITASADECPRRLSWPSCR